MKKAILYIFLAASVLSLSGCVALGPLALMRLL